MEVIVYTKELCPQCNMTKKLMKNLNVDFKEISLTEDPDVLQKIKSLGYMQAPVVSVDNFEKSWSGFKPDEIKGLVK